MRVVKAPPIRFKCEGCAAENEGDESEFEPQHNTSPPTWLARCGFCHLTNRVSPAPLIAKHVGLMPIGDIQAAVSARLGRPFP